MSRLSFTPTGARLCTDKQKVSSSKAQVARLSFVPLEPLNQALVKPHVFVQKQPGNPKSKSNKEKMCKELFRLSSGSIFSNHAVKMMNFSIYFVVLAPGSFNPVTCW